VKQFVVLILLLVAATSVFALGNGRVEYVGGTASNVKPGTIGELDTEAALVFVHSGGKFAVPFDRIESFDYWEKRARQLGVLLTIAFGLFKPLQQKHFFRIAYRDERDLPQAAVFEVPKQMPDVLNAVLQARVRPKSKHHASLSCRGN
jgi:hypothetical protein